MLQVGHEEFLRCFTQAQPVLRRFVLAHVPDFHEAEDTLQKVALVLWQKFSEYRPEQSFEGWAFGLARREVLHARRSSARQRVVLSGDIAEQFEERLKSEAGRFEERKVFLAKCIEKLPENMRRAIDLRYNQDLPTEQVAGASGVSANALRILLCRARRLLDECLRKAHLQFAGGRGQP